MRRATSGPLRVLGILSTALIAAMLTSGCSALSPAVEPGETGEPDRGTCHALERPEQFESMSDSAPAVPCTDDHTSETFMVTSVPSRYQNVETRPGFDVRADLVAEVCFDTLLRVYLLAPSFQGLFGVRIVGFLPTEAAWRDGDRWMRCDVVLSESDARLAPLTVSASLAGVMATDRADELSKCYQQDPDAAADVNPFEGSSVRCSEPHTARDVNNAFTSALEPDEQAVLDGCTDAIFYYRDDGVVVPPEDVTAVAREDGSGWVVHCAVVEDDD